MKKSIKTTLILISSFCLALMLTQSCSFKKIAGNGEITTKTISTADYDIIEGTGFFDIHLVKGTEGEITVTTDDNLHEYVQIEVNDNTLILKTKNNTSIETNHGIHITVPFEFISEVALTGSGNIESKDMITGNEFNASVAGSGDVDLVVEASDVQANISGSGDINLSGASTNLEVNVSGSGNFSGFEMDSQNTDVSVSGSGDAEVVAKQSIVARVSGSGDIIYKGNPNKKDNKTAGSGDITAY